MTKQRVAWVDGLRGVAIVLMVVYHAVFDWVFFFGGDGQVLESLFWMGRLAVILFLLLVGVGMGLRKERLGEFDTPFLKASIRRGLQIFLYGLVVTVGTYVYVPDLFVRFGILHFIGATVVLLSVLLWFLRKSLNGRKVLLVSIGVVSIVFAMSSFCTDGHFWMWGGVPSCSLRTVDYYPIFPWIFWVVIGLWSVEQGWIRGLEGFAVPRMLSQLGRYSLAVYLLHQPVLLSIMWMIWR